MNAKVFLSSGMAAISAAAMEAWAGLVKKRELLLTFHRDMFWTAPPMPKASVLVTIGRFIQKSTLRNKTVGRKLFLSTPVLEMLLE